MNRLVVVVVAVVAYIVSAKDGLAYLDTKPQYSIVLSFLSVITSGVARIIIDLAYYSRQIKCGFFFSLLHAGAKGSYCPSRNQPAKDAYKPVYDSIGMGYTTSVLATH